MNNKHNNRRENIFILYMKQMKASYNTLYVNGGKVILHISFYKANDRIMKILVHATMDQYDEYELSYRKVKDHKKV